MKLLLFCHSCCHHCRRCLSFLLLLKGLCHVCLAHFVNNANCGSFLAMELEKLLVNGKIIASSQTNVPPKHNIKHNKNKNELWKTVKLTSFQKAQLNLFQSSSSLSIRSSFCICCVTYNHLLFMFWAVIFVFHSVWWWLLLFEFWLFFFCDTAPSTASLITWRPVDRLCSFMWEEMSCVTYSVSAAVPAPQQLK